MEATIEEEFSALRETLEQFSTDCKTMRGQVRDLYRKTRDEETDLLRTPIASRSEALTTWWNNRSPLTIYRFLVELFSVAELDIDTRTIRLQPAEMRLFGKEQLTVFELMVTLPKLFHI